MESLCNATLMGGDRWRCAYGGVLFVDSDHLSGLNALNGLYTVAGRDVASVGISEAALTMVDRHRIA